MIGLQAAQLLAACGMDVIEPAIMAVIRRGIQPHP